MISIFGLFNKILKLLDRFIGSLRRYFDELSIKHESLYKLKNRLIVQQSYFPEFGDKRKSERTIIKEQKEYIYNYSYTNDFYYLYGFDIEGFRDPNQFIDYLKVFRSRRDCLNKSFNSPFIILRDKFLFGIVAESLGINTPRNIALIDNFKVYCKCFDGGVGEIHDLLCCQNNLDAFCKLVDGECANGVFRLIVINGKLFVDGVTCSEEELKAKLKGGRYIIQQRIEQHLEMNAIFSKSINTIRLVTVYNKQKDCIEAFSAVLRVGTGSNYVDNWAFGGLSIGIDMELGVLRRYGFFKPGFGTKVEVHPDSGVRFENFKIPFFMEAVSIAKRFHYFIKKIHSIGWDIAITPDGPCFIEGNDNWEISLMQACNGGLKEKFDLLFC